MKAAPREHIEAKIINLLHDAKAPSHASQIAIQIQETREATLQAIQRLVKSSTIRSLQDFTFLKSTGETVAYALADRSPTTVSFPPSVPPSRMTPPAPRS
jgi:hypothetical protein